jgi:hypothetical protein
MSSATLRSEGYPLYLEKGGTLPYSEYREACSAFNEAVADSIVAGKVFNPGHNLGEISVVRIERNYDKPRVDWAESERLKAEILARGGTPREAGEQDGEDWFVYFTDDWFCRFYWNKKACTISHKTLYSFHATRGHKGVKTKLVQRLRTNPLAYRSFRFIERYSP